MLFDGAELGPASLMELLLAAKLGLLRGKAVAVHGRLGRAAHGAHEPEARKSCPLLEEVFIRERREAEILPPDALLLAPVPVEDVGEDPARLLVQATLARVGGHVGSQSRDVLGDSRLPGAEVLARFARRERAAARSPRPLK